MTSLNCSTSITRSRRPAHPARMLRSVYAVLFACTTGACASMPVAAPATASLRLVPPASRTATAAQITITDSILATTIHRMRMLSPSFDSAMVAVEHAGIPVSIGTAQQLPGDIPLGYRMISEWQAITTTFPLTSEHARGRPIERAAVVVRLQPLHDALLGAGSDASDSTLFAQHLERVLAHEIYGHLMPQLKLGLTAPIACDDPQSAAEWYDACVMKRERVVVGQLTMARGTFALAGTR
ncbi:MAG TPA: hypothetical protein VG818_11435 [Gemmatimonadaceae bacterium]|jgi:hypothetical protein|nr:hypothetical protein [Gemmatimonadaceae bacterium]